MLSSKIIENPVTIIKGQLEKALRGRSKNKRIRLYIDQPFNLYIMEEQAKLYLNAIKDDLFMRQLYKPLLMSLEKNLGRIFENIPNTVDFIDLGPGYPDKTAPLIEYLVHTSRNVRYIPIDISKYFLKSTASYFKNWDIEIIPLNILFEEAPELLQKINLNRNNSIRIINIGFTFNNFKPETILNILKSLTSNNSIIIIAAQTIQSNDICKTLEPYKSRKADEFNFKILELAGFKRSDFDYIVTYTQDRIEMGYNARKNITIDEIGEILKSDIIITSYSYRYKEKQLRNYLSRYFANFEVIKNNDTRIYIISIKGEKNELS